MNIEYGFLKVATAIIVMVMGFGATYIYKNPDKLKAKWVSVSLGLIFMASIFMGLGSILFDKPILRLNVSVGWWVAFIYSVFCVKWVHDHYLVELYSNGKPKNINEGPYLTVFKDKGKIGKFMKDNPEVDVLGIDENNDGSFDLYRVSWSDHDTFYLNHRGVCWYREHQNIQVVDV